MSERAEPIDVGSLLTIDVESELRKLTQAQLQGPWQLPAELVRRAIRHGATRVELELGRQQLRVRSLGGGVPHATLRELAVLLDPQHSLERRHRALSALERAGELSLLGLLGLAPTSLQIITPATTSHLATIARWRSDAGFEQRRLDSSPSHAEVLVRGAKFDRTRAREWLVDAARHAPAEIAIEIDGRPLDAAGFEDAFAITRISEPVSATLALPREGELGRLYLLQDGLISTHMSVPEGPCFEAAIETRNLAEFTASPARLREVVEALIPELIDAAIQFMIRTGRRGAALAVADRSRLTRLLLHSTRRDREKAEIIAQLPLFRGIERDGSEHWCDLLALRQSVQEEGGERLLTALFPDQDPAEFVFEARLFILDESERALLGELLELGFRQPRRRVQARRGLGKALRELPSLLRGQALLSALRPGGRPLPDAALEQDERNFLIQLRAQLEGCEVAMCTGRGPVRRLGAGPDKLLLPRESARVQSAVVAVSRDPSWVYPALLALLDGRDFPERARRRWKKQALGG